MLTKLKITQYKGTPQVDNQVGGQVEDQIRGDRVLWQTSWEVRDQVWRQFANPIMRQVLAQVLDRIRLPFESEFF